MKKFGILLTVVWWLGIGAIIIEHNLAPFGHAKLKWNNPARTTAHFAWHQPPTLQRGQVVILPGKSRRFAVTLPRGFVRGDVAVEYEPRGGLVPVTVSASAPDNQTFSTTSAISPARLHVDWSKLNARGRTFDFKVSVDSRDAAVRIRSIEIIAQR